MNECQQVNIGPIHRHDGDTDNKNRTSFLFLTTPHKTANSNHLLSVFQRLFGLLTFLFCCLSIYAVRVYLLTFSQERNHLSLQVDFVSPLEPAYSLFISGSQKMCVEKKIQKKMMTHQDVECQEKNILITLTCFCPLLFKINLGFICYSLPSRLKGWQTCGYS